MKKLLLCAVIFTFIYSEIAAQGCTNCENPVNTGNYSSAIGINPVSKGKASFASGFHSEATADYTTALGFYSFATYSGAFALGSTVKSTAQDAVIIGSGGPWNENIYFINNVPRSFMVGFRSKYPTFVVTESEQSVWYNKTGRVGIGNITQPEAKLHIKADAGEAATVFIQPHSWSGIEQANIWLGNSGHGITASFRDGLVFHTQKNYLFNDGNVGIGTGEIPPETKLDVAGTVKMAGMRLNQGAQTGFVLTCSGINGQAQWQDPATFSVWSLNERNEAYRMGKVGIGVEYPAEMLDVNGNILVNDAITGKVSSGDSWNDPKFLTLKGSEALNSGKIMIPKGDSTEPLKIINPGDEVQFKVQGEYTLIVRQHEVRIGDRWDTETVGLKVNGKIWSHEVEVNLTDWSDEVFDKDYKLMPLHQLENYIETNRHLPDIPTEEEVLKDGVKLGEMNALLLKKVEELTLYVIELKKEILILNTKNMHSDN